MSVLTLYLSQDTAALSVGADDVAKALEQELNDRGLDYRLCRTGTRGMLWLEPMLEVEVDGIRHAYGPLEVSDIKGLLDAGLAAIGPHPRYQGPTEQIDYFAKQERLTFKRCGITDPLSLAEYQALDGFKGLQKALAMSGEAVCAEVLESGLRGRGGAGFPTGVKWQTVQQAKADQKYICCNADEGDSGTFADRILMEGDPYCLIEGMTIAAHAVGASAGYIYLRSEYPRAHDILGQAIEEAEKSGFLGRNILGSGLDFSLEVRLGAGSYICGEETAMLESLEGKRGEVRAKPPLPALEGLWGQPTIVNNVLTLAAVPEILNRGADFYQAYGQGRSRGTQAFQLSGNLKRAGLVEKAFGVTLHDLLYTFGGGSFTGRDLRAVQTGGPLGPYLGPDKFNVAMDYEEMAQQGAMLGHGGLVAFDDRVNMVKQARFALEFCALESCGKCTPCRIGSQRGVEVMDAIAAELDQGLDPADQMALLEDLCAVMKDGSLCAMGGLTPLPVQSAYGNFPEDFKPKPPRQGDAA